VLASTTGAALTNWPRIATNAWMASCNFTNFFKHRPGTRSNSTNPGRNDWRHSAMARRAKARRATRRNQLAFEQSANEDSHMKINFPRMFFSVGFARIRALRSSLLSCRRRSLTVLYCETFGIPTRPRDGDCGDPISTGSGLTKTSRKSDGRNRAGSNFSAWAVGEM